MPRRPPPRPAPPPPDLGPIWEADLAPVAIAFDDDPEARPALLLIVVDGYVLGFDIVSRPSTVPAEIAAMIAGAIATGIAAAGRAPDTVVVRHKTIAAPLKALLRAQGIDVKVAPELPGLDAALRSFDESFAGGGGDRGDADDGTPHPRVASPQRWAGWGLPAEQIGRLFAAAAAYYRAAPWQNIANEDVVKAKVRGGGSWSATVMGMAREHYGIAMYARHADLQALLRGDVARPRDSIGAIKGAVLSLSFSHRAEMSTAIRREIRAARWEVAGLAAFPHLFTLNTPGGGVTAREMEDLIILLTALPDFADAHEPMLSGQLVQRYPITWGDGDGPVSIVFEGARGRMG